MRTLQWRLGFSLVLTISLMSAKNSFADDLNLENAVAVRVDSPIFAAGSSNTDAAACECTPQSPAKQTAKPNPYATSHKPLFYDNDFGYINEGQSDRLGDALKQMQVGHRGKYGMMDFGGQMRLRYHHEQGMAQAPGVTRFQRETSDILLTRLRLFANWEINDWLRFYGEGIYAGLDGDDDYIPRPIDENYGDFLNLFFDVKLTDSLSVRVGRQELLYGNQRLASPLDWANTRRTFEGINVMYRSGDWAVDGFYTNFVPVEADKLDQADYDQSFYGIYSVFSGLKDATMDLYYFGYDDERVGDPIVTDFSLHTVGVRVNGSRGDWLYEIEGGPQFGRQSGLGVDHSAGFATAGIGRKLKRMPYDATLWCYYDYASGNSGVGDFNRFNHLYPLAHKYLGFIDATQRSNIESPNVLYTMKPTEKTSLLLWYHYFMANQAGDIVPAVGGTPAQSTESKDWGQELDIIATYAISPRSQILFGWSHFWAGNKITAAEKTDADFFYTEWTLNF